MAKKTTKKTTTTTTEEVPAVDAPVEVPAVDAPVEKKKRKTKKETTTTTEEAPVTTTPTEVKTEEASGTSETSDTTTKKKRRVVKKEDIAKDLDTLTRDLFENVSNKDLVKRIKQFKSDVTKILKLRSLTANKERDISNSGFMKPVGVSEKMRAFLELEPDQLTRRLDITKRLCEYIKLNDLQDPKDRRNILPDKKLRELLNMTEGEPHLTYYSIQQKLKDHIIKV